jgi:outer membrane protein OmpA-like peptidoglycan-associated protein
LKPGVANSGQISGVSLDQLQGVSIGGKPATLSANGATSTNIVVPALAPGVYDITYTMANGQTGVIAGGLTVPATSKLPVGVAVVTRDPAAATVSVALPVDTSSDPARVAVLQIFDAKGKLVQTLTRPVGANAIDATFAIPVNLAGYKVVAFTKNQFGVSAGAPISAALIKVAAPVKRAANGNAVVTGKIVAPAVSFAANSAALPKSSAAAIKAAAAFVKANGGKLVITGFTNPSSAPAAAAQKIAAERALAVAVALRKLGVNVWMNYSGAGIFNSTASPTVNRKAVISWVPNGI